MNFYKQFDIIYSLI